MVHFHQCISCGSSVHREVISTYSSLAVYTTPASNYIAYIVIHKGSLSICITTLPAAIAFTWWTWWRSRSRGWLFLRISLPLPTTVYDFGVLCDLIMTAEDCCCHITKSYFSQIQSWISILSLWDKGTTTFIFGRKKRLENYLFVNYYN